MRTKRTVDLRFSVAMPIMAGNGALGDTSKTSLYLLEAD
jgi:hypothetical protein